MTQTPGIKHGSRRRGGVAIIELALTLSVLTTLTFGMVEFSNYFNVKNMLEEAAREGARNAVMTTGTNSTATAAAQSVINACSYPANSTTISITDTSGNALNASTAAIGTKIEVTVSAAWGTIGAGFRPLDLIGSSKTVSGVAVMVKE